MYVYIESERWQDESGFTHILYTCGHYSPSGEWISESDHDSTEAAAARVHYLNGGKEQQ